MLVCDGFVEAFLRVEHLVLVYKPVQLLQVCQYFFLTLQGRLQ